MYILFNKTKHMYFNGQIQILNIFAGSPVCYRNNKYHTLQSTEVKSARVCNIMFCIISNVEITIRNMLQALLSFIGDLPQGGRHIPAYCCHRLFGPSKTRLNEPAIRRCPSRAKTSRLRLTFSTKFLALKYSPIARFTTMFKWLLQQAQPAESGEAGGAASRADKSQFAYEHQTLQAIKISYS